MSDHDKLMNKVYNLLCDVTSLGTQDIVAKMKDHGLEYDGGPDEV